MTEGALIFLSHASSDKPRIAHLVDYLLDSGYRLFIDHPEAIPGFTRDVIAARGIQTLWSTDENKWPERLEEAIDECDCVLVVVSDALTEKNIDSEIDARRKNRRVEWNHEISSAQYARKIAYAKIGSFSAGLLPRIVAGVDAQDVSSDRDPAMLSASLEILAKDRIPAAIESGKRRRAGSDGDEFRAIADLLPLCVGRREQRRAVMKSLVTLRQTKRIQPVLIAGPENELPHRLLDALAYEDDGDRSPESFLLKRIGWPEPTSPDFADDYGYILAEAFCGDGFADLEAVADAIAREGHPAVIRSRLDLGERGIEQWKLGEWLDFWESKQEIFSRVQIVPVVSLFLGEAKPGWTDWPPREADDQMAWKRNRAALDWLDALQGPEQGRYVRSPLTAPIRRSQAADWAENIHEDVLNRRRRRELEDQIEALYGSQEARDWGINHKQFHKTIADWLGGG